MKVPLIRVISDHKLTNEQMIQRLIDVTNWISETLFGQRDKSGDLIKDEHKDKDGNILATSYRVGLLQKFEGAKDMDEKTGKEVLLQPGMEQLWQELQQIVQMVAMNQKISTAMIATILKISPEEWFKLTEDKNQEMNRWSQNYSNIVAKEIAEQEKKAKEQSEALKDFQPNDNSEQS